jgi:hypothetical protein
MLEQFGQREIVGRRQQARQVAQPARHRRVEALGDRSDRVQIDVPIEGRVGQAVGDREHADQRPGDHAGVDMRKR